MVQRRIPEPAQPLCSSMQGDEDVEACFSLALDLTARRIHPGYARSLLHIRFSSHALRRMLLHRFRLEDVLETILKGYPDSLRFLVPEEYTCVYKGMLVPTLRKSGLIFVQTAFKGGLHSEPIDLSHDLVFSYEDLVQQVLQTLVSAPPVPVRDIEPGWTDLGPVQHTVQLRLPMSGCVAQRSLHELDRLPLRKCARPAPRHRNSEEWVASHETPCLGYPAGRS